MEAGWAGFFFFGGGGGEGGRGRRWLSSRLLFFCNNICSVFTLRCFCFVLFLCVFLFCFVCFSITILFLPVNKRLAFSYSEFKVLTNMYSKPCTVFNCKDFCGSTVLGTPESLGMNRADRLASTADITSGLQLGRAEVLRGLRNFLNTDKREHHSTNRLKERGVEKGSGRHSTLQGRERCVFNQTNIGTVSRATLGRLLRDRAERVWAFPSATMPS